MGKRYNQSPSNRIGFRRYATTTTTTTAMTTKNMHRAIITNERNTNRRSLGSKRSLPWLQQPYRLPEILMCESSPLAQSAQTEKRQLLLQAAPFLDTFSRFALAVVNGPRFDFVSVLLHHGAHADTARSASIIGARRGGEALGGCWLCKHWDEGRGWSPKRGGIDCWCEVLRPEQSGTAELHSTNQVYLL